MPHEEANSRLCRCARHRSCCHRGIGAVPGGRPVIGPVAPHVKLAQSIEQAEILVIDRAGSILRNRASQCDDAHILRPVRVERTQRIADLERALAVADKQPEWAWPVLHQRMQDIGRSGAVPIDRRPVQAWRIRHRAGKRPPYAGIIGRDIGEAVLRHGLGAHIIMQPETEPAAKRLKHDIGYAIAGHDGENRLCKSLGYIPSQCRAAQCRTADAGNGSDGDIAGFGIGRVEIGFDTPVSVNIRRGRRIDEQQRPFGITKRVKCDNSRGQPFVLRPSEFFLDTPASEKGWQGKPASRTSNSGISEGSAPKGWMSPAIT